MCFSVGFYWKELVVNTSEGDRSLACFLSVPAIEFRRVFIASVYKSSFRGFSV